MLHHHVIKQLQLPFCSLLLACCRVYATPRARRAITTRQNIVDPGRLSPSYEARLAKYSRRGFRVAVPGFPGRRGIDSSIYLLPYMECKVTH